MVASTRSALSRELIATTALALTDDGGLSSLSMRKLGTELGVEAMSLYHYVDNKDDLLDAMLEALFLEIELPVEVPEQDWESAIRQGMTSFHEVLLRHTAALELFATRPAKGVESLQVLRFACDRLQAVGLDLLQAMEVLHVAVAFVMGHTASVLGTSAMIDAVEEIPLDDVADPSLREVLETRWRMADLPLLDSGLDVLVAGLRATYDLP